MRTNEELIKIFIKETRFFTKWTTQLTMHEQDKGIIMGLVPKMNLKQHAIVLILIDRGYFIN